MKAEQRREQIMDAATHAFSHLGYQNTSISEVCDRAGIARGTLYQYFDDKQALFREVIAQYADRLRALMQSPTLAEFAEHGAEAILRSRLELIFSEIAGNKALYSILINEARAANAETRDLVVSIQRQLAEQMAATVAFAVAAGVADLPEPRFAAEFIIGAVFQIATTYILDLENPVSAAELAAHVTEFSSRIARLEPRPTIQ